MIRITGLGAAIADRTTERALGASRCRPSRDWRRARERDRIALYDVEIRARGIYRSDVDQWYGDLLAPGSHCQALISIGKTKLEAHIGGAVTIIVDLDFIDGLGIEIEVIWTAIGVLQRDIICNKSYIAGLAPARRRWLDAREVWI